MKWNEIKSNSNLIIVMRFSTARTITRQKTRVRIKLSYYCVMKWCTKCQFCCWKFTIIIYKMCSVSHTHTNTHHQSTQFTRVALHIGSRDRQSKNALHEMLLLLALFAGAFNFRLNMINITMKITVNNTHKCIRALERALTAHCTYS